MKIVINGGEQIKIRPFDESVSESLLARENAGNPASIDGFKSYAINTTPFVRINCMQEVTYESSKTTTGNNNNLPSASDVLADDMKRTLDGLTLTFDTSFDDMYSATSQVIGRTIGFSSNGSVPIKLKNPRRVPPPTLTQLTAKCGESAGYYTTAQLNFTVNSLEQLEFLVPFLFNPANAIFLEWGNNSKNINNTDFFSAADVKLMTDSIGGDGDFYGKFNKTVLDSEGDYEFMFGVINNFNFDLNKNLGYDVSVDVISSELSQVKSPANIGGSDTGVRCPGWDEQSLDFYLKMFYDTNLSNYKNNPDTPSNIIELIGNNSNSYVTISSILKFLRVRPKDTIDQYILNKTGIDLSNGEPVDILEEEGVLTGISNNLIIDKSNEIPIVSYTDDVLIFREEMYVNIASKHDESGDYRLSPAISSDVGKIHNKYILSYGISDISSSNVVKEVYKTAAVSILNPVRGAIGAARIAAAVTDKRRKYKVTKKYFKPKLVSQDDNRRITPSQENLANAYIKFDTFSQIYKDSLGKPIDVMKKLIEILDNATGNILDLVVMEAIDETTQTPMVTVVPLSSTKLDTTIKPYVFKFDSKNSMLLSANYNLGLAGLLGDYVYSQALGYTSGDGNSEKLHLSIFTNHENGLTVNDVRATKLKKLMSKRDTRSTAVVDDNPCAPPPMGVVESANGLLARKLDDDVRLSYNGIFFVDKDASVQVNDTSIGSFNSSFDALDEITIAGNDPITDIDILYKLKSIYKIERIPLVFSKAKDLILVARRNKSETISQTPELRKLGGIHPLLESKLTLSTRGIGGINPLQYFKVSGIPSAYSDRGQFCVMDVQHTVTSNGWVTQLEARFRPTYHDEES